MSMLISEKYRILNEQCHEAYKEFGIRGYKVAPLVMELCARLGTKSVLDYGCGKGALANNLPFPIQSYDPAVKRYSSLPDPADIVVCSDVLEHIEPECLAYVLEHLMMLTRGIIVLTVSTRPAGKILADGSNAHAIIQPMEWWFPQIATRFTVRTLQNNEHGFIINAERKDGMALGGQRSADTPAQD